MEYVQLSDFKQAKKENKDILVQVGSASYFAIFNLDDGGYAGMLGEHFEDSLRRVRLTMNPSGKEFKLV